MWEKIRSKSLAVEFFNSSKIAQRKQSGRPHVHSHAQLKRRKQRLTSWLIDRKLKNRVCSRSIAQSTDPKRLHKTAQDIWVTVDRPINRYMKSVDCLIDRLVDRKSGFDYSGLVSGFYFLKRISIRIGFSSIGYSSSYIMRVFASQIVSIVKSSIESFWVS